MEPNIRASQADGPQTEVRRGQFHVLQSQVSPATIQRTQVPHSDGALTVSSSSRYIPIQPSTSVKNTIETVVKNCKNCTQDSTEFGDPNLTAGSSDMKGEHFGYQCEAHQ